MMAHATSTGSYSKLLRITILLTLVGLGLRLLNLGAYSLWYDEALEVLRAQTPWPKIVLLGQGVDPPIYRLLISPIAALTLDEFWLRLPSAIFSTAAIFLAFYWLALVGHPKLGVILAGLLAVAPAQIYYAQEVSQYSLTVTLSLVLLITHERAARFGRWRDWLLLGASGILATYSYYGLAFLLAILGLDLAWRTWRNRSRQRVIGFVLAYTLMFASIVVLYFLMLADQIERFSTRKSLTYFNQTGFLNRIGLLADQLKADLLLFLTIPWSPNPPVVIVLFIAGLLLVGCIILWRLNSFGRRSLVILFSVLLLMYVAFSMGVYPFGWRYALLLTPLFFLPIAALISWLWRWRWPAIVLAALVLIVFVFYWPNMPSIRNPWLGLPRESLKPVISHVEQQRQPGDRIYVYYGAAPAYRVYMPGQDTSVTYGSWFRQWTRQERIAEIEQEVGSAPRFWLVMSHIYDDEDDELIDGLSGRYELLDRVDDQNAAAALFRQRS
jgi:4-amino-4-deoxy-L-arabinose transferase-like glycosyltransferase